jgi:hypothetical protein
LECKGLCILKERSEFAETYQLYTHTEALQAMETAVWYKYLDCFRNVTVQYTGIKKHKFKAECEERIEFFKLNLGYKQEVKVASTYAFLLVAKHHRIFENVTIEMVTLISTVSSLHFNLARLQALQVPSVENVDLYTS